MIKPPGKPGIAIYFSSKATKKDTYGYDCAGLRPPGQVEIRIPVPSCPRCHGTYRRNGPFQRTLVQTSSIVTSGSTFVDRRVCPSVGSRSFRGFHASQPGRAEYTELSVNHMKTEKRPWPPNQCHDACHISSAYGYQISHSQNSVVFPQ